MPDACTVCATAPATHRVLMLDWRQPHVWTISNAPMREQHALGSEFCVPCAEDACAARNARTLPAQTPSVITEPAARKTRKARATREEATHA